jgi:acyl phosphate:glycerol-3-phosphate acyltransferase
MIELGLKFTLAYLIGSVLGSLVVGFVRGGIDIRRLGSGNAGGTNALRTQGKWFALWVMVIDVGKGILAAAWIPGLAIPGVGIDPDVSRDLVLYAVAFAAVVGHVFPLWFGFKGGKGGATAAGLLLYFDPVLGLPVLGAWLGIILLTGFVGLSTMGAAVGAAAFIGLTRLPEQHGFFTFACTVAALILYTHRSNIRRMLDRTEPRFRRVQGSKVDR